MLQTLRRKASFYDYLDGWVKRLHFDMFCPEYDEYREDIGYLILNTQVKYGADLNPQNFDRQLPNSRHPVFAEDVPMLGSHRPIS